VATVLPAVSADLSLAICGAVALYYALPFASASQAAAPAWRAQTDAQGGSARLPAAQTAQRAPAPVLGSYRARATSTTTTTIAAVTAT
jgi:hypothetical protein